MTKDRACTTCPGKTSPFWRQFHIQMPSFDQDRLGTNIGKAALKKRADALSYSDDALIAMGRDLLGIKGGL